MTSKEIQDMIIDLENQIKCFGGMSQFNYQLDILKSYKQDLERLEVLELSNKTLDQICETQHEENEKLIKAIEKELALLNERRETFWFTDSYDEYAVVNEIIEELKEVLENESRNN